ncbi:hypothetical protein [Helicobacter colisuis]|uniref:Uncharacterized protein n=1 Tax=Helicobacter colisuis TaxID=2949739 RepID=A0ABT0TV47_9HELI|nr:hypothetical protein [Helicobacter colisuis]MCL9819803.1 hypothetical protein [Helicobacter colisuis]
MLFNEKEPSMVWKEEDLIELAKGKKAFQSSVSKWSNATKANVANKGGNI